MGLNVGRCLIVFYAKNIIVGARDLEWLQNTLNFLNGLFRQYGLVKIVTKSRTMTCQPGAVRLSISEEAVGRRCTGLVASYHE